MDMIWSIDTPLLHATSIVDQTRTRLDRWANWLGYVSTANWSTVNYSHTVKNSLGLHVTTDELAVWQVDCKPANGTTQAQLSQLATC